MKLFIAFLAAAAVVTSADQCNLTKLRSLLENPAVQECTEDSKYSFLPPTRPTDVQLAAICKSDACKSVVSAVAGLGLPDCEIGAVSLKNDLLERVSQGCSTVAAATTAPGAVSVSPPPPPSSNSPVSSSPAPTSLINSTVPASSSPAPSSSSPAPSASNPSATRNDTSKAASIDGSRESDDKEDAGVSSGSDDYSIDTVGAASEAIEVETDEPTRSPVPTPSRTKSGSVAVVVASAASMAAIATSLLL